jgi:hypothetical protein
MLREIWKLLSTSRWFLWMSVGYLFTMIGSGLTQIVVYGQLAVLHAPPSDFAWAFVVSLLASLSTLRVGEKLLGRTNPFLILASSEIIGAIGLAIPWIAISLNSESLLIASTFLPGACVGLGVPAYSLVLKRAFSDADMAVVAAIDSIVLSANVILGSGVGAILFPFVGRSTYLAIDLGSYVVCAACLFTSWQASPGALKKNQPAAVPKHEADREPATVGFQKISIYRLVPAVAAWMSPAVALLPAAGSILPTAMLFGTPVNAALILLFARGLSQVVGPVIFSHSIIDRLYKSKRGLLIYCSLFALLYLLAFMSEDLYLSFSLVLAAQVIGYTLSATAQTGMFKEHTESEIVSVSTRTYQVQLLAAGLGGVGAGSLADHMGLVPSLAFCFLAVAAAAIGWSVLTPYYFVWHRGHSK